MELILASGSPRRRELLERMGIAHFRVLVPEIEEVMDAALLPARLVETLSDQKATAAAALAPADAVIIAADTVVAVDGAVLGKPVDAADARRMLAALSGRDHVVFTGLTVRRGDVSVTEHVATTVTFRTLTEREMDDYVRTGEPLDKAGAYGIQGIASSLVTGICGDFYNIMGLPIARLAVLLARFGVDVLHLAAEGAAR